MCYCDLEEPAVYTRVERTARVVHRCCECGRFRIAPGDKYVVHSGLWDGHWDRHKRCLRCERVAIALDVEDGCVAFRGVRAELRERTRFRNRGRVTA